MAPAPSGASSRTTVQWRRWAGAGFAVALLFLALVVLRRELEVHTYHEISSSVRAIPRTQLMQALLWTLVAFAVLPGYDALALSYIGRLGVPRVRVIATGAEATDGSQRTVGMGRAGLAGIIAYGVSQAIGFPAFTGGAIRYRFWSGWGLSTVEIARAASFVGATFTLGIVLVSGLALLLEPAAGLTVLRVSPSVARAVGAVFVLTVMLFLAWSVRAGGRDMRLPLYLARRVGPAAEQWTFEVPRPALAFGQVIVALVDWAAAAAVLWVLLPPGSRPPFAAFAGLFVIAQFAGLVSHVPGGLGVFETIIVLGLRRYLPAGQTFAALMAYRAVYYLLPFVSVIALLAAYEARRRSTRLRAITAAVTRTAGGVGSVTRRTVDLAGAIGPSIVPTALAAAVFAAGVVLLLSGATPSVRPRVDALHRIFPAQVVEVSHLLGSLAGALLLVLAWALRRRLGAAWGLTIALLSAGVATSLLKGFDWEEALVQAAVLAAVLPFRRAFYRRSALTAEPFEPSWVVAIVAVLGVTVWVGLFSFKHVEYASDLWWRVHPHADAPRFLRATLLSAGALAVLGAGRLLRPGRTETARPDEAALARASAVALRSTDTRSHLALLGDKALLFNDADGPRADGRVITPLADMVDGFVQYGVAGRSWIAMGDPVLADALLLARGGERDAIASLRARADLAWRFKAEADAHGGWPVFYDVSAETLPLYIDLGLTFLKLGEEARVDLAAFSLEGGQRNRLRRAIKEGERAGLSFELVAAERVPSYFGSMRAISDDWLTAKHVREKGFSLGYFDETYLGRFPVGFVWGPPLPTASAGDASTVTAPAARRLVAFCNVLPGAARQELAVDLMRHSSDAPKGVMDYLFLQLMLWGKAENYHWFNLGMAPLAGLEARQLAPLWAVAGAWLYRHGEHFYNYQGLRRYKEKFDPVWEPRYLASPGGMALPRILANVAALISGGLSGIVRK